MAGYVQSPGWKAFGSLDGVDSGEFCEDGVLAPEVTPSCDAMGPHAQIAAIAKKADTAVRLILDAPNCLTGWSTGDYVRSAPLAPNIRNPGAIEPVWRQTGEKGLVKRRPSL